MSSNANPKTLSFKSMFEVSDRGELLPRCCGRSTYEGKSAEYVLTLGPPDSMLSAPKSDAGARGV
jgi:hypothetical protein